MSQERALQNFQVTYEEIEKELQEIYLALELYEDKWDIIQRFERIQAVSQTMISYLRLFYR